MGHTFWSFVEHASPPDPATINADQALNMAKLAEAAERYEEMTQYMMRCVANKSGNDLTVEQRNLISVGYKNLMSARRTAFRVTAQEIDARGDELVADGEAYKQKIAGELQTLITEVTENVVKKFTTGPEAATDEEVLVFFHKMEGDYNRYGAEISSGDTKEAYGNKAAEAYKRAHEKSKNLVTTNPIRLGLALNFSVFYYEILDKKEDATQLAQQAFDDAIDQLDQLYEEQYRDSTLIMQLLKDNLSLWGDNAEENVY